MNLRGICCRVSLAALAGTMLAYADQINQAEVFVNPNSAGGTGPFSQVVSQPGMIDIGGSATGPATGGPVESGDGSAHVEYGKIKLFNSVFASATGESSGRFRDDVLLDDPTIAIGTPMTVTYSLFVDGLLSVNSTGYGAASWLMQSALGSNLFNISKSGTERSPELSNPGYTGDPLGQLYTAQATIQNGIAAQLDVELTVDSSAGFDPSLNPGAATENFLNTLAWGGIQEVTLGGQQVAYTLSSSSGTDWSQDFAASETGVPEPATPMAAVAAIGVCLGFLRKRSGLTNPVSRP